MARDYRVSPNEITVRATNSNSIQFVLLSGTAAINLTSPAVGTVELWLKDQAGGTSMTDNLTGKLSINGSAGGSVLWTPGTGDVVAASAPYSAYFKLYSAAATWWFVPEDSEFTVNARSCF